MGTLNHRRPDAPSVRPAEARSPDSAGIDQDVINTTEANGSTPAAEVLAARFRAAGFADADVLLVGPNPRHLNLVVRYHGSAKTAARPILFFIAHLNVVEARREGLR